MRSTLASTLFGSSTSVLVQSYMAVSKACTWYRARHRPSHSAMLPVLQANSHVTENEQPHHSEPRATGTIGISRPIGPLGPLGGAPTVPRQAALSPSMGPPLDP